MELTKQELEILIYEQAIRSQAQQVNRMFQRAEAERNELVKMEQALQKMRETYLSRVV